MGLAGALGDDQVGHAAHEGQVPGDRRDPGERDPAGDEQAAVFWQNWLNEHPLTVADLEQEAGYLQGADIVLDYA